MKHENLIKKLESTKVPKIEIQSHQRRLRLALLNSGYFKEKTIMSLLKNFAPIGTVAVIVLLVVAGVNCFKSPSSVSNLSLTPVAYAKKLITASEQMLKGKTGAAYVYPSGDVVWKEPDADGNIRDEKGNIIFVTDQEGKLAPTPKEVPAVAYTFTVESFLGLLEEAKQAKDLIYMGDKVLHDGRKIKVLQFTDDKGNVTILGIDENKLPVVRLFFNEDIGVSGGVILQPVDKGSVSNEGTLGLNYGKISEGAPQSNFKDQIKYWTEDLEQPKDFLK